ncbi:hemin uptake protein HemP [Trinickia fusca]|uniref:Hemin uptake protein HemP n=1 Tax=Trinickia fusca TaxID=2419777 RepID=A0A494XLF3_9BURK|nr:hemin uptake protein HemP [Trinickia fusca]RKP50572.1 hemin uptake protein HemP [Trinickia fusca]
MTEPTRPSTLTLRGTMNAATRNRSREILHASAVEQPAKANNMEGQHPSQRIVRSDTLLQGRSHVLIAHNGETYQLRATRLGKLILTK